MKDWTLYEKKEKKSRDRRQSHIHKHMKKGGVDSKPCKSIWFFRHGQRTELTIACGASAPWSEYQSGGEEK